VSESTNLRSLLWVASSKRDFMDMPDDVTEDFGFGLYQAQKGKHPRIGKILKGFGGAGVIELVKDCADGTFRAVYTVRFEEVIVVLHAFQKKSKKGIETPKQDIELIRSRLKLAEELYETWKGKKGKNG
jgi:phage-related protein